MKHIAILAAFAALVIVGCGAKEETAGTNAPTTSTSGATSGGTPTAAIPATLTGAPGEKREKGICVVCWKNSGSPEDEPVHSQVTYEGKEYYFCEEKDKAAFIADPKKFAVK